MTVLLLLACSAAGVALRVVSGSKGYMKIMVNSALICYLVGLWGMLLLINSAQGFEISLVAMITGLVALLAMAIPGGLK